MNVTVVLKLFVLNFDDLWFFFSVVTGGTDGIGLAYVEYLAALGINVVIISRTLEKLQNISKRIGKL